MKTKQHRGFTIIELLVVIAIMAVVAGLVVWGAARSSEQKKISRAEAENAKLVTLIEAYKLKLGVYPPQNTNDPSRNSLFYELAGAIRHAAPPNDTDPLYETPYGDIRSSELFRAFEVTGIVNSSDDKTEIKRFLKNLKPDEHAFMPPPYPANAQRLVLPLEGVNGTNPVPWSYLAGTNELNRADRFVRNPNSFDLWAHILVRRGSNGKSNIVGNWKD